MSNSVLIVEDEIVLQDVYKLILSSQGYDVHTASNGAEGIVQLKSHKPHVVLLDMFMPVMDGKEFLRNIDVEDYPSTKFVVFTNLSSSDTANEMLELGAHKFILKSSMAPQDLLALIEELTVVA
jgi:CheY-like chemotaxis protein